jgi:hypothetical protein
MAPATETEAKARRRRRIALGEAIGIAALLISALGLWNSWRNGDDKPAVVVDRAPRPIPLVLRGAVADDGKVIQLNPLEESHALDQLVVAARAPAKGTATFGSEPMLSAAMVETWLPKDIKHEGSGSVTIDTVARYVESGETRTAKQRYRLDYRWKDGGLLSGKSVRLTGLSRG